MNHLNYSFNVASRKNFIANVTPIIKQVKQSDGSVSVISVEKHESPFEGMSAFSFSLDSQIEAGVRLTPSPRQNDISLNQVDGVINDVNNVESANKNGVKLNNKK